MRLSFADSPASFKRISWSTRSALVEQLRGLEDTNHVYAYVMVLFAFENNQEVTNLTALLNAVPVTIRIHFVSLFEHLSISERQRVLYHLQQLPRNRLIPFLRTICDPSCAVGTAYLRVFGVLDPKYDDGMLLLLQYQTCWSFVDILSDAIRSLESTENPHALVNGFASSLTLFTTEDEFSMLRKIVDEALSHSVRLDAIVLVLAHFRTQLQLFAFLHFVQYWTRYLSSTLLFRVFAQCQTTVFLFEMCYMLDLDDAMFAIKRIDRMWKQDPIRIDSLLLQLSQQGVVQAKDEFCNLVLGFKERASSISRVQHFKDHCVTPRSTIPVQNTKGDMRPEWEIKIQQEKLELDSTSSPSLRPIKFDRLYHQIEEKSRKKRRPRNWRDWKQSDWEAVIHVSEEEPYDKIQSNSSDIVPKRTPFEIEENVPEQNSTSNFVVESTTLEMTEANESNGRINQEVIFEAQSEQEHITLPPILPQPSDQLDFDHTSGQSRPLNRSESAPSTLTPHNSSHIDNVKQYRGLNAALGLPESNTVARNRGANFLRKQCIEIQENSPCRIRYQKTQASETQVNAARVRRVLGVRTLTPTLSMSSLGRGEPYTIQNATQRLVESKELRSIRCFGLVSTTNSESSSP